MMHSIITASKEFVATNSEMRGEYELAGGACAGYKSHFPIFCIPKIPFPMSSLESIYSKDGINYMACCKGGSSAFFGSNGSLGNFPSKYTKTEVWEYSEVSADEVSRKLDGEGRMSSSEFLGAFDVPTSLVQMLKLRAKRDGSIRVNRGAHAKKSRDMQLEIYAPEGGGVTFEFLWIDSSKIAESTSEGGFYVETGYMAPGKKLVIDACKFSDLGFIGHMNRDGASLRVTKGSTDNYAFLEWTSPSWDGAAFTTADVQSL